jgi:NADH-quinone oxidoreductase subunit F
VQYFKDEYVAHWEQRGCPFDHSKATLFDSVSAPQLGRAGA